jgi:N-hydroxyarylamine O-acetyltransferase
LTSPERLPDELADAYLALLDVDAERGGVDEATLRQLQAAHVGRVPYETLDIVLGRPPGIDPIASVRRIVGGRGGYCYHLNGAFSALLAWLGVDVTRHLAGVQRRGGDAPGPNGNHLGLTVRTQDGRAWLVDVGLGDGPAEPLPLALGVHEQRGHRYRLARSMHTQDGWRFEHDATGSFEGFDMESSNAAIGDFAPMHAYLSTESGFARTVTAQRRVGDRVEILRGCVFTESTAAELRTREITDPNDWWTLVIERFRLAYGDLPRDERAALWRRVLADHETWKVTQPS